jgi:gluconate 2-dehydrogenase gamma chain
MWEYERPDRGFFTLTQKRQVEVLFDGILPPGRSNPGARDCAAADYLDYLLADPLVYYEIAQWQAQYTAALDWLNAMAQHQFARELAELLPQQCSALLCDLAAAKLPNSPESFNQAQFFGILRSHCIEGCFADQRWGGNRENVMWQWYGYPTGPACDFDRTRTPALSPSNKAPAQAPQSSGNTATASKDPLQSESATIPPTLLSQLINAYREPKLDPTTASREEPEAKS